MNNQQMNKRPRKPLNPNDVYAILSPFGVLFSLLREQDGEPIYACDVATIGRALYDNAMAKVQEISEGTCHD